MSRGPTQTATDRDRWEPQLGAARAVTVALKVAVIGAAFAGSYAVVRGVPRPKGFAVIGWLLAAAAAGQVSAMLVERLTRRLCRCR